jgi:hypothetical protein
MTGMKIMGPEYFIQMANAGKIAQELHRKLMALGFTCIGDCYTAPKGLTPQQLEEGLK